MVVVIATLVTFAEFRGNWVSVDVTLYWCRFTALSIEVLLGDPNKAVLVLQSTSIPKIRLWRMIRLGWPPRRTRLPPKSQVRPR